MELSTGYQLADVTAQPVARAGKGCVWNQQVEAMVKDAGLQVLDISKQSLWGLVNVIVATKP